MNRSKLSLMTFQMGLEVFLRKMTITDTLKLAKDAGVPCVDLMGVGGKNLPLYQQAMVQTNVRVCCYITSISFFGEKDAMKAQIERDLETAAALQAKMLMIVPYAGGKDLTLAETMAEQDVRQKMIEGFRLAVALGEKRSIPVCFETTPHHELRLSGTADCKAVLDAVPGLGFVFDTANMLPAGDDPLEAYETLKSYIVHVHLKDVALQPCKRPSKYAESSHDGKIMKCVVWGEGVIPVGEIYRRLQRDGYQGFYAIEYARPKGILSGFEKHKAQLDRFLHSTVME